jgi:hypothetical protein
LAQNFKYQNLHESYQKNFTASFRPAAKTPKNPAITPETHILHGGIHPNSQNDTFFRDMLLEINFRH